MTSPTQKCGQPVVGRSPEGGAEDEDGAVREPEQAEEIEVVVHDDAVPETRDGSWWQRRWRRRQTR